MPVYSPTSSICITFLEMPLFDRNVLVSRISLLDAVVDSFERNLFMPTIFRTVVRVRRFVYFQFTNHEHTHTHTRARCINVTKKIIVTLKFNQANGEIAVRYICAAEYLLMQSKINTVPIETAKLLETLFQKRIKIASN